MASNTEEKVVKIIADGKQAEASINQITKAVAALNRERNKEQTGSKKYTDLTNDLKKLNTQLGNTKNEVRNLESASSKFWSNFKSMALGSIAGNAALAGFQSIISGIKSLVSTQADLSDEYANIRKVTGLTMEGVKALDKQLGSIDTRTSRKELRELAVEAGKLGIDGKDAIAKFVKEADQIKVALGEDLGPEAITQIGRLSKIFKVSMLEIGSGINEIGAQSAATEAFQVDFLNRLAGTGPTAKLAAGDLLGYSATLENMGQTAEVSGTALSKFFIDFIKNVEKFGGIAGMKKGAITEIFNSKGTNAAFMAFLENLKKTKGGTVDLARALDGMGIDGARSAGVFLALANNNEEVAKQQAIANKAIADGTSLTNEFNIKNDAFAAKLEKLGKVISGKIINSGLSKMVNNIVNSFVDLTSEADAANKEFERMIMNEMQLQANMNVDLEVLKDKNLSDAARRDLLKEVNSLYGDYLPFLLTEKSSIEDINRAQQEANASFEKSIFLKTYNKELEDAQNKLLAAQRAVSAREVANKRNDQASKLESDDEKLKKLKLNKTLINIDYQNTQQAIDNAKDELKQIEEIYEDMSKSKFNKSVSDLINEKIVGSSSSGFNSSSSDASDPKAQAAKLKAQKAAKKQADSEFKSDLKDSQAASEIELQNALSIYSDWVQTVAADTSNATKEMTDAEIEQSYQAIQQKIEMEKEAAQKIKDLKKQAQQEVYQLTWQLIGAERNRRYTLLQNDLETERTAKLSNGKLTEEQRSAINEEYDKKRKVLLIKQAREEKQLAIFKIAIETGAAAVKALATDPTGILSAWVIAQGALQAGIVAAQPVPQMKRGGVTGAEDGKTYYPENIMDISRGGVAGRTSLALIAEDNKPELIVPNWLFENPRMANTMGALQSMIQSGSINQYASGGATGASVPKITQSNDEMRTMVLMLSSSISTLNNTLQNGIVAQTKFVQQDYDKFLNRIDSVKEISKL